MRSDTKSRTEAIRWYHSIDLGNGLITAGEDDTRIRLARLGLPSSLTGLTVLDVGAWDGFFSFECERRGASRVVAAEHYSWSGAGWGTKAGFQLVREILSSRVEDVDIDVMDLSAARIGQFDIVLFLGTLYHLRHPLLALERVADVTRHLLIVETVVDLVGLPRPAAAFYPGRELAGDPTNWWGPNPAAVEAMLKSAGFDHVRMITATASAPRRGLRALYRWLLHGSPMNLTYRQDRAVFHAAKHEDFPLGLIAP